jgi:copper chaperone CopZ
MAERVTTARILVDGMTCGSCEQRIEKAVSALEGVRRVGASASLSEVMVYYEPGRVGLAAIHDAIRGAGYRVRDEGADPAPTSAGRGAAGAPLYRFLGLLAVIAAVFLIIRYSVGFTFLPAVSQSMGYGLIFVVGCSPRCTASPCAAASCSPKA